jgi:hypothetical protein
VHSPGKLKSPGVATPNQLFNQLLARQTPQQLRIILADQECFRFLGRQEQNQETRKHTSASSAKKTGTESTSVECFR